MDQTALSERLSAILNRAQETLELMIPPDVMPSAGLVGLTLLAVGLFFGIFGAQYAKGILSAVLGGLGFAIGYIAANTFEIPPLLGGLAGLLALACLGYYTYRLWVGVAVGLLASSIGLFAYGHDSLWPASLKYEPNAVSVDSGQVNYQLQPAKEQQSRLNPQPVQYLMDYVRGLWEHLREAQPQISKNAAVVSTFSLVVGFAVGLLLTRVAVILACAFIGTMMVNLSLATFAEAFAPGGWSARIANHPQAALAFIFTCFLLSMLIQFRMTQQTSPASASDKQKG